jgi:rubrerythrin
MRRLTQKELMNYAFKMAVEREERFTAKYFFWSKMAKGKDLTALFGDFAVASRSHVAKLKQEMGNYNIK